MRVFISWSKPASRQLASALREWLPDVIQQVKPWMSQEDVPKGERWLAEIAAQLDEVNHGIVCVTSENVTEPWLNFEAGALAKSLETSQLWTLLLDLSPTDFTGPLTTFQATSVTDEHDMFRFLQSLNSACLEPLKEERLRKAFERTWPDFAAKLQHLSPGEHSEASETRTETDMVAETLERVRAIERAVAHMPRRSSPPLVTGRALRPPLALAGIASPDDLAVGNTVLHPTFGLGAVLELGGGPGAEEVLIRFDAYGRKRLVLAYAPLSLVVEGARQLALGETDDIDLPSEDDG